ncbi:MAG: hypothetical protein U0Z26_00980 [Anaerolineales bacterium]
MKQFRDIEQLSAYVDGQLSPSDSARIESRLQSDPELAAAYEDIRLARGILRKLPLRKAPRNFLLTRKMVGQKPPLPRVYSLFQYSSVFATILLFLAFAFNSLSVRGTFNQVPGFVGPHGVGGGGGGCDACGGGPAAGFDPNLMSAAAATEVPAATEAPAAAMELAPAPTNVAPLAPSANDAARQTEVPAETSPKEPTTESAPQNQPQAIMVPETFQYILLVIGLIGFVSMYVIRQASRRKWK